MEELNKNDETVKKYDFSSVLIMGEKEHRELNSVSWAKISVFLLVFLIVFLAYTVILQFFPPYSPKPWLYLYAFAWTMFLETFLFFMTKIQIKRAYKRLSFSQGSNSTVYKTYFGEKITVETDKHAPVEYDYDTITAVNETNNFYLLKLKYNLYLIIQKDIKSDTENVGFTKYIFGKCHNIKKRKVINVMNKEKISAVYLCLFAALFLFNLVMFFI